MPVCSAESTEVIVDNEAKFKTHAEKEFWEKVYIATIENSSQLTASVEADAAIEARRLRMEGLIKPGVKAA
jgi:hypothetical protein